MVVHHRAKRRGVITRDLETVTMNPTLGKVLCRARLWHDYRTVSNPDGGRYRACAICGKEQQVGGSNTIGA